MSDLKAENVTYFQEHLAEFLKDKLLRGKHVVIHGKEVRGAFDTFDAALRFAVSHFPANEFIVQQVIDEREVINFVHSAVC